MTSWLKISELYEDPSDLRQECCQNDITMLPILGKTPLTINQTMGYAGLTVEKQERLNSSRPYGRSRFLPPVSVREEKPAERFPVASACWQSSSFTSRLCRSGTAVV
jgi:hypothetical protein